jgi:effector-binding domain-containing protein
MRELPGVERMATSVHRGLDDHPITYNALGRWLEQHHYHIVGPSREILLEYYDPAEPETCMMEIQFPVEPIDVTELDFLKSIQIVE